MDELFTPILTQADFETAVAKRTAELTAQLSERDSQLEASSARIAELMNADTSELFAAERAAYSEQLADYADRLRAADLRNAKLQIAIEDDYTVDFVERLRGNTPEELRRDAVRLVNTFHRQRFNNSPAPPMFNPNPVPDRTYSTDAALKEWHDNITGEFIHN